MKPFSWALQRDALLTLLQFSERDKRRAVDAAEFLVRHPFQPGHLHYGDGDGQEIRVYFADHIAVHYCVDDAVRHVRIVALLDNLPTDP